MNSGEDEDKDEVEVDAVVDWAGANRGETQNKKHKKIWLKPCREAALKRAEKLEWPATHRLKPGAKRSLLKQAKIFRASCIPGV
ncbi:MAG: hypothetical protein NTX50_17020 [Candidatus Sumerlaeota bacterium]|nr:hypothetical protein [Candidatus Sumerlaeota bacterium]